MNGLEERQWPAPPGEVRELIEHLFIEDHRPGGRLAVPPESLTAARAWLDRVLIDTEARLGHIEELSFRYRAEFRGPRPHDLLPGGEGPPAPGADGFSHAGLLDDARALAVARDGPGTLTAEELAEVFLNPFVLWDLADLIDNATSDYWFERMTARGAQMLDEARRDEEPRPARSPRKARGARKRPDPVCQAQVDDRAGSTAPPGSSRSWGPTVAIPLASSLGLIAAVWAAALTGSLFGVALPLGVILAGVGVAFYLEPKRAEPIRALGRVGGQRGAARKCSPFPTAPLRTVLAAFAAHGSPVCSCPCPLDLTECRVATPFGSESIRLVAESGFVEWLKQQSHGFLHELVAPCRNAERPHLPVCLLNVDPANGRPLVSLELQQRDDLVDLLEVHAIHRFPGGTTSHAPSIPVYPSIGLQE
jgi:hypothetical protein